MTNCICKVKNNQLIGTGFFCRIPYKNNTKINVLITSYQIINEFYFNQNNQINLLINDYNELKVINLDPSRKIYTSKTYNTTLIELKECDNINNYLELDDNLFSNNIKSLFENESIYILQYLNVGKASVSYGTLNQLNGYNINHGCYNESCSNGAPILNLTNNKVIGITLETQGMIMNNYNAGVILKYPLEEFINKYQVNNLQMPDLLNNNFGMGMNNNFLPNMVMNNNFNFIPNMMMNNNFNSNRMEIYNMPKLKNNNNINNFKKFKYNVFFLPTRTNMIIDKGTTIDQMLTNYLKRVDRTDLIGKNNKIRFLYNASIIKFGDQTPVEDYFKLTINPEITVIGI